MSGLPCREWLFATTVEEGHRLADPSFFQT
jgi:hypothetical protein